MTDKRQWKDLMKEYPLLWHPKHPQFGDEDLKMIYRERLLERCNKECEPIDMETLKQRLAGFQLMCSWSNIPMTPFKKYLRKDKPTPKEVREQIFNLLFTDMAKDDKILELAAEFPCLWKRSDAYYGTEKATTIALNELQKQFNEQSETPIGKEELKAKIDGFKERLFWRSREAAAAIDELEDNRLEALAQEFPCICNPNIPQDLTKCDESCPQLLNMYNTGVNHHLTMDETKIDNLKKRFARKRLNQTVQIENLSDDDRIEVLTEAFPSLWNPLLPEDSKKYDDSYVKLLDQYNTGLKHQLTMNELRDKVDKLKSHLVQKHLNLNKVQIEKIHNDKLKALAREYPCLLEPLDPDYTDVKKKDESYVQLFAKYNTGATQRLTMEKLIRKVHQLKSLSALRRTRAQTRPQEIRVLSQNQTETHTTASSSSGIENLSDDDRIEVLTEAFPSLWNPLLPEDSKKYDDSYVKLLDQYNTGLKHQLTMNELRDKVDKLKSHLVQKHLNLNKVQIEKIHNDKLKALAREYPCLLEPLDPDYTDVKKKDESYVQLFAKYNTGATQRLTMEKLIRKVHQLKSLSALRRTRAQTRPQEIRVLSQNQTETHTTASSSSGKSQDSICIPSQNQTEEQTASDSSSDKRPQNIRVLAQNQTAAPSISDPSSNKSHQSTRIPSQNQAKLHKTIDLTRDIRDESIRMLTENQSKPRKIYDPSGNRDQDKKGINAFMDLAAEFPCLWNPKDINYMDKDIKERCWNQLLEKYNKHSSFVITMADLKERISRMRLNLLRRNRYYIAKGRSVELVTYRHDSLMELLVKEYPSLWDPQDINYGVKAIQDRCYEQLLEKCNNESSVTITMEHLIKRVKLTIRNYVRRGRFSEKKKQHNGEISEGRSRADTEADAPLSAWQDDSSDDDEPLTSLQKLVNEVGSKQQPSSAVAEASDVVTQVDACLQPAAMAGGMVQASATQQAAVVIPGIGIHFNWCCFCGEIKDDCHNLTIEKPYIFTNKTLLTLNDLSVVLDFSKDTTPKTICRNCDTRLYDIFEFIKSVKKAQEKISHVSTVDDFRENVTNDSPTVLSDYSESNEGFKNEMDFLSYTDTEFVKETNAFKRKTDENKSKPRKKCRVSIDLNYCTLPTFCDDSNRSYDMESNVGADSFAVTNEKSSNNTSANNTQDTINEDGTENAISNAVLITKEDIIEPNNDTPNEVISETPSAFQEAASKVSFEDQGPHNIIGTGVNVSKGVNLNLIKDVETFIVIEDNECSDTEIAIENAVSSKSSSVILESVLKDANSLEVIRSKTTTQDRPNYKTTNAIEDAKILLLKSANEYNEVFIKEESNEMFDGTAQIEPQLDCTEPKQSEEGRDSEVIAGNIVSQLAGSIDSLVSDKEVTQEAGPSNLTKEPSSKGEPMCVMPKSDLILLVESIVSRMMNK